MVVFILNTASPWSIPKRSTAPQHTRFILPPIHPTKLSLRCACKRKPYLENFMSRPNVISAFQSTPLQNRGRNFVRVNRRLSYTSSDPSTYFCVLTIRKQLPKACFERSGRGQEQSRSHKFSILENIVFHRDFTSSMRLHFRSDLVGVTLVGARPLHLLRKPRRHLKAPPGLSLLRNRGPTPNPAHGSHLTVRTATACCAYIASPRSYPKRQDVQ